MNIRAYVLMGVVALAAGGATYVYNWFTAPAPAKPAAAVKAATLHSATIAEWHAADDRNRILTAKDWVTVYMGVQKVAALSFAEHDRLAGEVVTCITKATEKPDIRKSVEHQDLRFFAFTCMQLMNFPRKE